MSIAGTHVGATRRNRRALAAVATAVVLLTASSCASDSEPSGSGDKASTTTAPSGSDVDKLLGPVDKAEGEPVKIGLHRRRRDRGVRQHRASSSPAKAAADYWNEHQGGIAGRPVELVTCATEGDPAGATDCANKMIAGRRRRRRPQPVGRGRVRLGAPARGRRPDACSSPPTARRCSRTTRRTYNLNNGNGTLFSLPFSVAKENDIEKITFVVIDVPQALTHRSRDVGPALLEDAGLDYELVKVPVGTADMTPQMQEVANSDSGLVHVIGNDAFCIAAFNGLAGRRLRRRGHLDLPVHHRRHPRVRHRRTILDGMYVTALTAVGATDDPSYQLYDAIMREYTDSDAIDDADHDERLHHRQLLPHRPDRASRATSSTRTRSTRPSRP